MRSRPFPTLVVAILLLSTDVLTAQAPPDLEALAAAVERLDSEDTAIRDEARQQLLAGGATAARLLSRRIERDGEESPLARQTLETIWRRAEASRPAGWLPHAVERARRWMPGYRFYVPPRPITGDGSPGPLEVLMIDAGGTMNRPLDLAALTNSALASEVALPDAEAAHDFILLVLELESPGWGDAEATLCQAEGRRSWNMNWGDRGIQAYVDDDWRLVEIGSWTW